jgi:hypothetical protein
MAAPTSNQPAGQQTAATAYPYVPYHPPTAGAYGQTATAYPNPYQTGTSYPTGVTGYGTWPYQYNYIPQHPQSAQNSRPAAVQGTSTTFTPTFSPALPPRTTFNSYTPSYLREVAASTAIATGRGPRKQQSNLKGLFAKECAFATLGPHIR